MASSKIIADKLLISTQSEVRELAAELANNYVEFFNVDISQEQECYQESIEECLAHLEEVMSALDGYKQSSQAIEGFVDTIVDKEKSLKKLFEQVDAIEQYAFETNRLLDQLDTAMKELERHQTSKDGKLKQLLHMIPGVSNLPRLGLLSALSGLIDDTPTQDFVEIPSDRSDNPQLTPIIEILNQMRVIDATLNDVKANLYKRLHADPTKPSHDLHEPMAILSLDSPENEDGSWQELL